MPESQYAFWWQRLEKINALRLRIELALLMPDLTEKNKAILENCLERLDYREATARFVLGLPYTPPKE